MPVQRRNRSGSGGTHMQPFVVVSKPRPGAFPPNYTTTFVVPRPTLDALHYNGPCALESQTFLSHVKRHAPANSNGWTTLFKGLALGLALAREEGDLDYVGLLRIAESYAKAVPRRFRNIGGTTIFVRTTNDWLTIASDWQRLRTALSSGPQQLLRFDAMQPEPQRSTMSPPPPPSPPPSPPPARAMSLSPPPARAMSPSPSPATTMSPSPLPRGRVSNPPDEVMGDMEHSLAQIRAQVEHATGTLVPRARAAMTELREARARNAQLEAELEEVRSAGDANEALARNAQLEAELEAVRSARDASLANADERYWALHRELEELQGRQTTPAQVEALKAMIKNLQASNNALNESITQIANGQRAARQEEETEGLRFGTCQICFARPADHVVIPCGHLQYCGECLRQNQESPNRNGTSCPTCRVDMMMFRRVFGA